MIVDPSQSYNSSAAGAQGGQRGRGGTGGSGDFIDSGAKKQRHDTNTATGFINGGNTCFQNALHAALAADPNLPHAFSHAKKDGKLPKTSIFGILYALLDHTHRGHDANKMIKPALLNYWKEIDTLARNEDPKSVANPRARPAATSAAHWRQELHMQQDAGEYLSSFLVREDVLKDILRRIMGVHHHKKVCRLPLVLRCMPLTFIVAL